MFMATTLENDCRKPANTEINNLENPLKDYYKKVAMVMTHALEKLNEEALTKLQWEDKDWGPSSGNQWILWDQCLATQMRMRYSSGLPFLCTFSLQSPWLCRVTVLASGTVMPFSVPFSPFNLPFLLNSPHLCIWFWSRSLHLTWNYYTVWIPRKYQKLMKLPKNSHIGSLIHTLHLWVPSCLSIQ